MKNKKQEIEYTNNSMTLADHAEAWYKENGNVVPVRDTPEWFKMYESWIEFAFDGTGE